MNYLDKTVPDLISSGPQNADEAWRVLREYRYQRWVGAYDAPAPDSLGPDEAPQFGDDVTDRSADPAERLFEAARAACGVLRCQPMDPLIQTIGERVMYYSAVATGVRAGSQLSGIIPVEREEA